MLILRRLGKYLRFSRELYAYMREEPIDVSAAREVVRRRLDDRESSFLAMARRCIFEHAGSPYLPLLRRAGCELGDLDGEVRRCGLEPTLERLHGEGVYVSFEEFKGRRPIVRGDVEIPAGFQDFDNPVFRPAFLGTSGGTTGPGTSVPVNLRYHRALNPNVLLFLAAHGLLGAPHALWFGVLPDATGLGSSLRQAALADGPERWFVPARGRNLNTDWRNRLVTRLAVSVTRIAGRGIPWPESVGFEEAVRIARWMRAAIDRAGRCVLRTHVSKALRIAVAAADEGIDLAGGVFCAGGEVPTPAKVEAMRKTGARFVSTYYFSEGGPLGLGCAEPLDDNDNHFMRDAFAVIQRPMEVPGTRHIVNGFSFTSLLPPAPKILLNVEIDDYGELERRSCGCELGELGLTDHLRHIRSARKLTGEGVTLVGSDLVRVIEEVLPQRFGGSPLDYQLVEEEDDTGLTRISLLVRPELGAADEQEMLSVVRGALREGSVDGRMTEAVWGLAGTLRVRRERPIWTGRGKLMPLHSQAAGRRPEQGGVKAGGRE